MTASCRVHSDYQCLGQGRSEEWITPFTSGSAASCTLAFAGAAYTSFPQMAAGPADRPNSADYMPERLQLLLGFM